jgi:hypothetical protein
MRHRWMYYATGLPGWMRFGYSPGWVGRSATGLGPCATYLTTGQWPMPTTPYPMAGAWPSAGFQPTGYGPADELSMLKSQAELLRSQLEAITKRLEELEKES